MTIRGVLVLMTFTYYDSEGHDTASVIRSVVDCDVSYVFFPESLLSLTGRSRYQTKTVSYWSIVKIVKVSGDPKIVDGRVLEVVIAMVFTALSLTFYGYQLSSTRLRGRLVVMNTVGVKLRQVIAYVIGAGFEQNMADGPQLNWAHPCSSTICAFIPS
ncbi:hypothetical protein EDD85DRAFT_124389 [Armillaria nabsnona]|nr:hypothetical protein EDD85DRAFT_124389 [Armillaria nabsnona]